MKTWTPDELNKIAAVEEVGIAPLRRDGKPRKPVTIWIVRLGDDLYIRSAYGRTSGWFRGAQAPHGARITAGDLTKGVMLEQADQKLNDDIDAAYHSKYRHHSATYVNMMVSFEARSTTARLTPRLASS